MPPRRRALMGKLQRYRPRAGLDLWRRHGPIQQIPGARGEPKQLPVHDPEGFRQHIALPWIGGGPPALPILERAAQRIDLIETLLNIAFKRREKIWLGTHSVAMNLGAIVNYGLSVALNGSLTFAAHKECPLLYCFG